MFTDRSRAGGLITQTNVLKIDPTNQMVNVLKIHNTILSEGPIMDENTNVSGEFHAIYSLKTIENS